MGFELEVGDRHYDFEPDNCTVNLFREHPEMDYIAYHLGENQYMALFDPAVCHWLGGIALTSADQKELKRAERNLGTYAERFGGNPRVIIDDRPDEDEIDLRVRSLVGEGLEDIHDQLRLDDKG